jgi:hypothetical protein
MNWRARVIEKHPPVCRESFWGHPLGTITTNGPPKFDPILKSIRKNFEHFTPIFFLEHESSFSFKLGSSKTFLVGF